MSSFLQTGTVRIVTETVGAENVKRIAAEIQEYRQIIVRLNDDLAKGTIQQANADRQLQAAAGNIQRLNNEMKDANRAAGQLAGGRGQGLMQVAFAIQDVTAAHGNWQQALFNVQNNLPLLMARLGMGAGLAGSLSILSLALEFAYNNWRQLTSAFRSDLIDHQSAGTEKLAARMKELGAETRLTAKEYRELIAGQDELSAKKFAEESRAKPGDRESGIKAGFASALSPEGGDNGFGAIQSAIEEGLRKEMLADIPGMQEKVRQAFADGTLKITADGGLFKTAEGWQAIKGLGKGDPAADAKLASMFASRDAPVRAAGLMRDIGEKGDVGALSEAERAIRQAGFTVDAKGQAFGRDGKLSKPLTEMLRASPARVEARKVDATSEEAKSILDGLAKELAATMESTIGVPVSRADMTDDQKRAFIRAEMARVFKTRRFAPGVADAVRIAMIEILKQKAQRRRGVEGVDDDVAIPEVLNDMQAPAQGGFEEMLRNPVLGGGGAGGGGMRQIPAAPVVRRQAEVANKAVRDQFVSALQEIYGTAAKEQMTISTVGGKVDGATLARVNEAVRGDLRRMFPQLEKQNEDLFRNVVKEFVRAAQQGAEKAVLGAAMAEGIGVPQMERRIRQQQAEQVQGRQERLAADQFGANAGAANRRALRFNPFQAAMTPQQRAAAGRQAQAQMEGLGVNPALQAGIARAMGSPAGMMFGDQAMGMLGQFGFDERMGLEALPGMLQGIGPRGQGLDRNARAMANRAMAAQRAAINRGERAARRGPRGFLDDPDAHPAAAGPPGGMRSMPAGPEAVVPVLQAEAGAVGRIDNRTKQVEAELGQLIRQFNAMGRGNLPRFPR